MINETMHPEAEELTNLLFAMGEQPEEERAYHLIDNMVARSDEVKADLYARIVEAQLAEVGKVRAVAKVSRCLWQNHKLYPRG